jgi:hypothetical protein
MNSEDVVQHIVASNRNIAALRFFEFTNKTKLQDRLTRMTAADREIVDRALHRKRQSHAGFWEALLCEMLETGSSSRTLITAIFFHQANRDYQIASRDEFRQWLSAHRSKLIALNSRVLMEDGNYLHIPLLDFKIAAGQQAHGLVGDCILSMGLRGYLLASGRSYHFMGVDPVTEQELLDMLAAFTLLHPISDKAWAAHQLIERSASLRVTAKGGVEPQVIRKFGLDERLPSP